jgi:hypothetical protein
MSRSMTTLLLAPAMLALSTVPASAHTSARAVARPAAACTTTGYSKNCAGCKHLRATGGFTIKVAHTKFSVKGKGTADEVGTTLCVTHVATPVPSRGGVGVRVTATGAFSPLKVPHAHVFFFKASAGALKKVKAIRKPGLYQLVRA